MKIGKKTVIFIMIILVILSGSGAIYASDYYQAVEYSVLDETIGLNYEVHEYNGYTFYGDEASENVVIFYPGGKVEAKAYEPIMQMIASNGIGCALVDMPLHLAVFNIDGADNVMKQFPDVENWYLSGHSLGGAMAAEYAVSNQDRLSGLILLAAYPTKEFSKQFPVLSVYGSNDKVLKHDKYTEYIVNATNLEEVILEGGNHAQFGNYGMQSGDGVAHITPQKQWEETADAIIQFVNSSS